MSFAVYNVSLNAADSPCQSVNQHSLARATLIGTCVMMIVITCKLCMAQVGSGALSIKTVTQ